MNLNDLMNTNSIRGDTRIGLSSTVKDEVQSIQLALTNSKHILESQRKTQSQLQHSIKKLQEQTKTNLHQLHKQISDRISYLNEAFLQDCQAQNKEFQYLEMQNKILGQEHEQINQIATKTEERTRGVDDWVGR